MSDIYEFLFGEKDKAEIVEKNAFMQMVDDIKALNIDSFLTRLLGPLYTSAKGLYDKLFGEGSSKKLVDTGTNMLKSASTAIGNVTDKIAETGVGKAIASTYNAAKETGSKVVSGISEGASKLWSGLKDVGGRIFSGEDKASDKEMIRVGKHSMRADVYDAIIKASKKYGIPADYMFAMAKQESAFNPNAKAPTSSATGLYQFISKTWDSMWGKPTPDRTDPYASADAAARYALITKQKLGTSDPASLYLGHFLGPGGADKLIDAMEKNPNMLASSVLSANQIAANKSVFKSGSTVTDIYNWAKKKMDGNIDSFGGEENIMLAAQDLANKQTTRDQSSISPVGQIPNLTQQIDELKAPTAKEETPQERVATTTTPEPQLPPMINVNNVTPPQKDLYAGTYAKSIDPYYLDGFLSNLFPSMFTTFTNNVSKTFLFGDSLNLNPQTV
jgi:hypothetical protein